MLGYLNAAAAIPHRVSQVPASVSGVIHHGGRAEWLLRTVVYRPDGAIGLGNGDDFCPSRLVFYCGDSSKATAADLDGQTVPFRDGDELPVGCSRRARAGARLDAQTWIRSQHLAVA